MQDTRAIKIKDRINDLNTLKVCLVYPSRLQIPWPSYKHYASNRIEERSLDYVRKTYVLAEVKEQEFIESKISDFICMAFPDGTEEQLQLLTSHVICFGIIDDIVDQPAQFGAQYEKAVEIFADIEQVLDESKNPNNFLTIYGKEHSKIYKELCAFEFTDDEKSRYWEGFFKYKSGSLQQINHRKNFWQNVTVKEYTLIRRNESGIPWYFQFIQWTNGSIRLPKDIWHSDAFEKLIILTSDFISHANDAASYAKEYCCGDHSNIITVIVKNYQHLTTQDSLYVTAELTKLVIKEFDITVDELMKTQRSRKLKNDLDRIILGIRKHISGYALWNSMTPKYMLLGEGHLLNDVSLEKIDVTNVPIEGKLCKIAKEIFSDTYSKSI